MILTHEALVNGITKELFTRIIEIIVQTITVSKNYWSKNVTKMIITDSPQTSLARIISGFGYTLIFMVASLLVAVNLVRIMTAGIQVCLVSLRWIKI